MKKGSLDRLKYICFIVITAMVLLAVMCLAACSKGGSENIDVGGNTGAAAADPTGSSGTADTQPTFTGNIDATGAPVTASGDNRSDDPYEINIDATPTARVNETPGKTDGPDGTVVPGSTGTPEKNPTDGPEPTSETTPADDPGDDYKGLSGLTASDIQYVRSGAELKHIDDIILQNVDGASNTEEKIRQIHEWMVKNIAYDTALKSMHIRSLLETGRSTCQGYAELFYVFMTELNIPVRFISGTAGGSSHAWNAVQLGGEWYYVDVTWDDPLVGGHSDYPDGSNLIYKYFLVTEEQIASDHSPETELPAPAGKSSGYHDAAVKKAKDELLEKLNALISSGEVENGFIIDGPEQVDAVIDDIVKVLKVAGMRGVAPFKFTVYFIAGTGDTKGLSQRIASRLTDEAVEAYQHTVSCSMKIMNMDLYGTMSGEIVLK